MLYLQFSSAEGPEIRNLQKVLSIKKLINGVPASLKTYETIIRKLLRPRSR